MATQTRKRTRAKFVSKQTVEQVGAVLQDLPEKTPDNHSLRQAVEQLRETIEASLAKGYSYEDLIPILAEQGIDIQPSTLKRYILTSPTRFTTKRSSSGKTKTRQARKKPAPTVTKEDTPVPAEVSAPAPTASRKKRTKAAAQEEAPTPVPATHKRGRAAAKVTPLPTATETVEATTQATEAKPIASGLYSLSCPYQDQISYNLYPRTKNGKGLRAGTQVTASLEANFSAARSSIVLLS